MKTLVLVSVPGSVLSLDLSDFPTGGPVEGRSYEFGGRLFKVTEITETLGSHDADGRKVSPDMRLLQFVDAIARGDEALKQRILKPRKVGSNAPEETVSKGGIILPPSEDESSLKLGEQFEHIIFVQAIPAELHRAQRGVRLMETALGAQPDELLGDASANDGQLEVPQTGSES